MKIKMLESMAGRDFSLSAGDTTDRFNSKEAKRFIDVGIAELAPPDPVRKPETKKEWDDEREKLLAENERLIGEATAANERADALAAELASLSAFKALISTALATASPVAETTEAGDNTEKRA